MFHSNLLLFILSGLVSGSQALAQSSVSADVPAFDSGHHLEAGVGFVQWNESLTLLQGPNSARGYANYAGPSLELDYSRLRGRWVLGVTGAIAGGKAAAAGFKPGFTYADGVDRLWYGGLLNAYAQFRVNPRFMLGLGALARYRTIDWTPASIGLVDRPRDRVAFAPTLNMRWHVTPKIAVTQSFAVTNADTGIAEMMWNLALGYRAL